MFFTDMEFIEPEEIKGNPMISKVKIKIAKAGRNRNMYNIDKEVLESAARKTLGLTPIISLFNTFTGDFGEHGFQAIKDSNGEYVTTSDTSAVGVIPENPEVFWEDDYLTTYGYLWTSRYKNVARALDGRPQSMELSMEHSLFEPMEDGYINITETAFEGLCILGKDVTPAFEEASVRGFNFSYKGESTVEEDVEELMKGLKFALDNGFKTPLVVDIDGEERDKQNREKISSAIDRLDEAADLIVEEEVRNKLDDAISELVQAEIAMKKEADVIPVTEAARRGLEGQPGYKDGIVSTENLNYSKAQNSLLKKNKGKEEEEEELAIKKKDEEVVVPVQEDQQIEDNLIKKEAPIVEEVPVAEEEEVVVDPVQDEEVVEKDVATPSEENNPGAPEGVPGGEEEVVEDEAEDLPENPVTETTGDIGVEVQEDPQGDASAAISEGRKNAEDKRASALLSDLGDDELFGYLVERLEQQEEIKTRLQELLGTAVPDALPEGGEVEIGEGETNLDELGSGEIDSIDQANPEEPVIETAGEDTSLGKEGETVTAETVTEETEGVVKEDTTIEVEGDGGVEGGEGSAEAPVADTPAEDKVPTVEEAETPAEDDEEKKKKGNFSLDFKAIVAENVTLTELNFNLTKENEELSKFKASIERVEKESALLEFSLSEEGQKDIMSDLDNLSLEEVEAKAALTQHRENKAKFGQKESRSGIVFSSDTEEAGFDPLQSVLEEAQARVKAARN